jgi:uncharacterized protein (DUF302 family)
MSTGTAFGTVQLRSHSGFIETVERLDSLLWESSIQVFCRIDHSAEASKVGLALPSTLLVIFGSPKAGTPLMLESPSLALDLPQKALITEDEHGAVWVTYNSAQYLRERHHLSSGSSAFAALAEIERLLERVVAPPAAETA